MRINGKAAIGTLVMICALLVAIPSFAQIAHDASGRVLQGYQTHTAGEGQQ